MERDRALSDRSRAVRQAVADAAVAGDVLATDLDGCGGIDGVTVTGSTVTVTVALPVPSEAIRSRIVEDIRAAVEPIGMADVDVRFEPNVSKAGGRVDLVPDVKNIVAVASGKGGVGKSTVAVNLATALADAGAAVGLLDADVYGPNVPSMLGVARRRPSTSFEDSIVPQERHGVKLMSMGFLIGEEDPVIWRGPIVDGFVKQLFGDVEWGALDYLIVDLPPGTGDAHLSLVQHLPVVGAVIVTTPQAVAVDDATRGLTGFARYDVPILGIVENMSGFTCPTCDAVHDVFDSGGATNLSEGFNVPVLGRIPLDPVVGAEGSDEAPPDPPGVSIPGIGRLQLPRTHEERSASNAIPTVLADPDGEAGRAFSRMATLTAARIQELATSGLLDR